MSTFLGQLFDIFFSSIRLHVMSRFEFFWKIRSTQISSKEANIGKCASLIMKLRNFQLSYQFSHFILKTLAVAHGVIQRQLRKGKNIIKSNGSNMKRIINGSLACFLYFSSCACDIYISQLLSSCWFQPGFA